MTLWIKLLPKMMTLNAKSLRLAPPAPLQIQLPDAMSLGKDNMVQLPGHLGPVWENRWASCSLFQPSPPLDITAL